MVALNEVRKASVRIEWFSYRPDFREQLALLTTLTHQSYSTKGFIMARYITLLTFTEQGATNIQKSTKRAHSFDRLAEKTGVRIVAQYWTMGQYDGVLIVDAETEQQALHMLTELGAAGNVRTETMQAFIDKEFDAIIGRI